MLLPLLVRDKSRDVQSSQSNSQPVVLRPDLGSLEKELEEAGEKVQQKIQKFADADDSQSMLQINSECVRLKVLCRTC